MTANGSDQDSCRICSGGPEPEAPLFYPCRCKGSIKFIHQECLTTWLEHSKKRTCDVCKHPFAFTKVYSPDMPEVIPPVLFLRRFVHVLINGIIMVIRSLIVTFVWLVFIPFVTIWSFRTYFYLGDTLAWSIKGGERPPDVESRVPPVWQMVLDLNSTLSQNLELDPSATSPNSTETLWSIQHPIWITLSSDIFTGQVIASLIVLVFLSGFLLREWVVQNARPGVFEHGEAENIVDADAQAPAAEDQPPPADQPAQPVQPVQVREARQTVDAEVQAQADDDDFPADGPKQVIQDNTAEPGSGSPLENGSITLNTLSETFVFPDDDLIRGTEDSQPSSSALDHSHSAAESDSDGFDILYHNREDNHNLSTSESLAGTGSDSPVPTGDATGDPQLLEDATGDYLPQLLAEEDALLEGNSELLLPQLTLIGYPEEESDSESFLIGASGLHPDSFVVPAEASVLSPSSVAHLIPLPDSPTAPESVPLPDSPTAPGSSDLPENTPRVSTITHIVRIGSGDIDSLEYYGDDESMDEGASVASADEPNVDDSPSNSRSRIDGRHSQIESSIQSETASTPVPVPSSSFRVEAVEEEDDFSSDEDRPRVELNAVEQRPEQRADGRAPANEPEEQLEAEERDIIDEDEDMNGVLEAIGMRGPIFNVIQNSSVLLFCLDTAIGAVVWLPFTLGKTLALLALEPKKLAATILLPVTVIRLMTDPIVDTILHLLSRINFSASSPSPAIASPISTSGQATGNRLAKFVALLGGYFSELTVRIRHLIWWLVAHFKSQSDVAEVPTHNSVVWSYLEPTFAPIGASVRRTGDWIRVNWIDLAHGDDYTSRVFAIFLGYAMIGVVTALYLNILTLGSVRSAGRALRHAIKQQAIMMKVGFFIFLELVLFPFACGGMLNFSTLALFPEATIWTRWSFLTHAPVTSVFYHWMAGTMFMYHLASVLATCRKVMRPGALWFVKDPHDPAFHPIRDIMERPTLTQLRKLCLSALVYCSFVLVFVGGTVFLLLHAPAVGLAPLRWYTRKPLSTLPVDLLFVHIAVPPTFRQLRSKRHLQLFLKQWWHIMASVLQLSSYMFNKRRAEEEICSVFTWPWKKYDSASSAQLPGSFRRVPAGDNAALLTDRRAWVTVDANGNTLNDEDAQLMRDQDEEVIKAKRDPGRDYVIVYVPPHFRLRVISFVCCLWFSAAASTAGFFILPTQLGRLVFHIWTGEMVHDLYSFTLGFFMLLGCWKVGRAIGRMERRRQRWDHSQTHQASWPLLVFKKFSSWSGKVSYMFFFLAVVIPTFISLVLECYFVIPAMMLLRPSFIPTLRLVDSWARGLLLFKIYVRMQSFQPETDFTFAIARIKHNGWRNPDPLRATYEVIAPLTGGLLGMLFFPASISLVLKYLFPHLAERQILFTHIYPSFVGLGCAICLGAAVLSTMSRWTHIIRDKEFLLELRLRNLDQDQPRPKRTP